MPREFVTSDLHFGDRAVLHPDFAARRFRSTSAMDEALIRNFNKRVGPNDETFFLGDIFAEHVPIKRRAHILQRLNGTKHLIVGNHDDAATTRMPGWASVQDSLRIDLIDGSLGFVMAHKPPTDAPVFDGSTIYLHGHLHTRKALMPVYDVGVDAHAMQPVPMGQLVAMAQFYRSSWKQLRKMQGMA